MAKALCASPAITAPLVPLAAREGEHPAAGPETMLLIGDKVVNAAPDATVYPHQLDLGEQWKALTGLLFVFAMWMMRRDAVDLELARLLAEARRLFHLSEVGFEHLGPPAERADLVHGGLGALGIVRVMQGHVGAPTGKFKGNLPPDPGAGAGDEYTFAEHL